MKNREGSSHTSWWKHKRPEGKRAMNKYERKQAKQEQYAQFRFRGRIVSMEENEFHESVEDGEKCGCGECLDCRCAEYWRENNDDS